MNILQAHRVEAPNVEETAARNILVGAGHTVDQFDHRVGAPDFTGYDMALFGPMDTGVGIPSGAILTGWTESPIPVVWGQVPSVDELGFASNISGSQSITTARITDPLHPIAVLAGLPVGNFTFGSSGMTAYNQAISALPASVGVAVERATAGTSPFVWDMPAGEVGTFGTTVTHWVFWGPRAMQNISAAGADIFLASFDYALSAGGGGGGGSAARLGGIHRHRLKALGVYS